MPEPVVTQCNPVLKAAFSSTVLHGVLVVEVTLQMTVPLFVMLSYKATVPATFEPIMMRRTTPAPLLIVLPVAVENQEKELPTGFLLFGESDTTSAVSLAAGTVDAALTVAVFVPSVIRW